MRQLALTCGIVLALGSLIAAVGLVSGDHPPRPGTDDSGLGENETATLWSKEPNECLSDEEYYDRYGENRTDLHALGNCTDITFAEPPDTAETWTAYDFESLESGGSDTSVYPASAETEDSLAIADAHATAFAVQPSTIVHKDENETPLYVAPDGEFRGLVDYRVRVPDGNVDGNRTTEWSLLEHELDEVRLKQDDDVVVAQEGQHTPTLEYHLGGSGPSTLTFEADIEVRLEREITERVGNQTETRTELEIDELTVSSDLEVHVYDLTAVVYYAEYPDGSAGVAIYQAQPWHGYILSEDGDAVVRGNWRYYTARDTDWDRLVESSATDEDVAHSDALPVYVRAYPSDIGPRADPIRDGPDIAEVWGTESSSPNATIHENVEIDVVEVPYTRSSGLAIRHDAVDRDHLEVQGIVRGTTATLIEPDGGTEREIRESNLSVEILEQNESAVTVELELRDAKTGDPIALQSNSRFAPIGIDTRDGYIAIADEYVQTDSAGRATVTISQPGIHTATYHPGSWRTHDPAYVGDTASVSWHPLATASGWFTLFVDVFWLSIPFLVALYAGLKLGSFLRTPDEYNP
ncbi:hypothetical protein C483_00320 [Natrialba hulunbeirensis JCM 10989]|uniref:Uncharacterized protein n=1 Tax=Natrialba hulunbeirensis JCM 10989 TaxID=1227493 RepID=M0ACF5_9EURY|nr:hypothetical protein [Natrialba hulunbeirensis]ELY96224.1 hypothetical protein C483_00320 [Natrialba hulunbeirensis JCM 10989]